MDKYQLVVDAVEHPDSFTPEQLEALLADPEAREIYTALCLVESAGKASRSRDVDVDAEWEAFVGTHVRKQRRRWMRLSWSAASIALFLLTSIVAVAVGIAVVVRQRPVQPRVAEASEAVAPAVIAVEDTVVARLDSVAPAVGAVMFEDASLEDIMRSVGATYGVEVRFASRSVAALHLFWRFDPALPLDRIMEQLNTFEQINIRRQGNTLIVD